MGGIGVISGGFLAAGLALSALPIVLHLLFRRKAPIVDLGSLRFLRIATRDNARRRKVRRWLLLALRLAGVLLLALLFARPYRNAPDVPGEEREVAILVDRSASMGAGSAFSKAKAAASALIREQPRGTAVHLALFDGSGVAPVSPEKFEAIASKPGPSGTDYSKAVDWARDQVIQSRRKLRQVHVFTDLRRPGLDHPSVDDFPPGIEVEVVDVGRPVRANLGVVEARAIRAEVRPGHPPLISATVENAGAFPARGVAVKLVLDGPGGTVRASETVDLAGLSRREVRFSPAITRPGLYRGSVEVDPGDELPFDDLRWLAFEVKTPEAVLVVDGEPGPSSFGDETYFLEAALRLRLPGDGAPATPYEPRRIAWEGGGGSLPDLAGFRVVVLANVADLPAGAVGSLKAFVEGGGRLVIFSGGKLGPGALGSLGPVGLLPAEVGEVDDRPARFDDWNADHPIFRPFADPQHGDLRSLTFAMLATLRPRPGSTVLASTRGDRPILVEATVGEGKVLQWAIPADDDWGDWTVRRLYLPLIHQMMGYLTGRLPGTGPIREADATAELAPGIVAEGPGVVVRNADPAESRVDRVTQAEFRDRLKLPEAMIAEPPGATSSKSPPTLEGATRPGEFWRPVAWALLVVLVAETFLANRTYA